MSNLILKSGVERTPKVIQMEAMFDIPAAKTAQTTIIDNLPDLSSRPWNIGLIVGASGSGKSTIARKHFGDLVDPKMEWDINKAVIDAFPTKMSVKDVALLLSSVGFSSPPAWLRPFHTLSNGEQFRVSMARLLAENPDATDKSLLPCPAITTLWNGLHLIGHTSLPLAPSDGSRFGVPRSMSPSNAVIVPLGSYSHVITI